MAWMQPQRRKAPHQVSAAEMHALEQALRTAKGLAVAWCSHRQGSRRRLSSPGCLASRTGHSAIAGSSLDKARIGRPQTVPKRQQHPITAAGDPQHTDDWRLGGVK